MTPADPTGTAPAGPAFGGGLGWGDRPALLLVDLMAAYFTAGSPLDLGSRAPLDAAARLLDAARAGGHLVVHTRVAYAEGAADGGLFVRKVPALHLLAGDDGGPLGRLMPEVAPRPGEPVIVKQYASAFFGTSLAATLVAAGVDTVVVAGVSTSGCIRASATDALQHGLRPVVVREACGDRTIEYHASNLRDLAAKYADVVGLDEARAHLSGRAGR